MMRMKRVSAWLMGLMLLMGAIPGFAEEALVQEVQVSNTPIKGVIQIEKTGLKKVGLQANGSPITETGALAGAVFEIRAAEQIVGKDNMIWFYEDELVATVTTDENGFAESTKLPLGTYNLMETKAPDGYVLDATPHRIELNAKDQSTPVVFEKLTMVNDPIQLMCLKVDTAGNPMPGITFELLNATTMQVVEKAVSDEQGAFVFTPYQAGDWIIREKNTPDGFSPIEDIHVSISSDGKNPAPILCVNIPDHYAIVKTDSSGVPLSGVHFVLEDEDGNVLEKLVSDKNGLVEIDDLAPGTYYIKETETLKGYTLSGEVRKIVLDEYYIIPDKLPTWVNYTTIQTGVNLVVTSGMWVGLGLMAVSGTVGMIRRRRKH